MNVHVYEEKRFKNKRYYNKNKKKTPKLKDSKKAFLVDYTERRERDTFLEINSPMQDHKLFNVFTRFSPSLLHHKHFFFGVNTAKRGYK